MKKIFWTILIILFIFWLIGDLTTCEHDFELVETTSTCTEYGNSTYKCTKCDETKTVNEALGHTTYSGECERCGFIVGDWIIEDYLDEFDNETGKIYTKASFHGTYEKMFSSGSATCHIYFDSQNIFMVFTEGTGEYSYNSTALFNTYYSIIFLDESGTKHYTDGIMYADTEKLILEDETLLNLLNENELIEVYIESDGLTAIYHFDINKSNFEYTYGLVTSNNAE